MPSAMSCAMCFGSPAKARAMNVAPAARAMDIGLNASSMAPSGEVVVTNPLSLVGEDCPLVRPYIWLFSTIWVMFGFRRLPRRRHGQGPPVSRHVAVDRHVVRELAATADAGD